MLQKTFALLHRSLRTDVRLLRTHFFRAGLLGFVLFWLFEGVSTAAFGSSPGLELFSWLLYCNFWFITLAGGLYFSSAITEEKEEQTLGLLRLAGISPPALLLGKWLPRLIGALLLIAIQFPFTLLAITLGGVLIHQVVSAYCTLAAHLVLCGSIGLFASVVCPRSGPAAVLAVILMIALHLCSYPIDEVASLLVLTGYMPSGWIEGSPREETLNTFADARIEQIMVTGFDGSAIGFQVVSNLVMALLFAGASWLLFNRMTQNETAAIGVSSRWIMQFTRLGRRGSRRVWSLPLVWKDFYQFAGGGWTLLKIVVYPPLMAIMALILDGGSMTASAENVGLYVLWIMLCTLLLEVSILAARVYRDEVKAQTWPLLVLLPRSLADVSYAKLAGALLGLGPALFYFCCGAVLAGRESVEMIDFLFENAEALLLFAYVVLQFALFWHLSALLSIVWRWAAWPVAIFFAGLFVVVGNMMMVACVSSLPGPGPFEALLVVLCFVAASLVFATHVWIGAALDRLAGE